MKRSMTSRGGPDWLSRNLFVLGLGLVVALPLAFLGKPAFGASDDALSRKASWEPLSPESRVRMFREGLEGLGVEASEVDRLSDRYAAETDDGLIDPIDRFVELVRPLAPVLESLVATAEKSVTAAAVELDPDGSSYAAFESLPSPVRMTVRTWLGRQLVRKRLYDEALPILAEVKPTESVDPAGVLFYRGVCYHALLMKDEALADLQRLLEQEEASPVRFVRTAKLMANDLKPLKEDSLDEISRLMTDVTRRLDLGRTDEQVKRREQTIIDKLTKLIDKIEEQQKQQQQQQQQQGGGGQGGSQGGQESPMEDSRIAGANGAGDVDRKRIDQKDGWGNLPPAERQEALQQIGRDLPTHYREAIEAYFRKLATDD